MKSFKDFISKYKAECDRGLTERNRHRRVWGIAKRHAKRFNKSLGETDMTVDVSYTIYEPCVDIDIHLGKKDPISSIYPLVDALIKDPRLTMTEPLPAVLEDTDSFSCKFEENTKKKTRAKLRVYVFIANSQVCVSVGTGKYKEITRVVCGHYDDAENFVEKTE